MGYRVNYDSTQFDLDGKIGMKRDVRRKFSIAADNLCTQFGPRSGPTNVAPDLDGNCLTPGVRVPERIFFFFNFNFFLILKKKIKWCQQKHEKLHRMQIINGLRLCWFSFLARPSKHKMALYLWHIASFVFFTCKGSKFLSQREEWNCYINICLCYL